MKKVLFLILSMLLYSISVVAYEGTTNVGPSVVSGIFKQLMKDDNTFIKGKPEEYIAVRLINKHANGDIAYLVEGLQQPFYGARTPLYFVYREKNSKYKRIGELGGDGVTVLGSEHNGFKDIKITGIVGAGAEMFTYTMVYNGDKYVDLTDFVANNPFLLKSKWSGYYVCGQGKTNFTLEIEGVKGNNITMAVFNFSHSPSKVKGSFVLQGEYDSTTKRANFVPVQWFQQPAGYEMVGMNGVVLENPRRYEGRIVHPNCGSFSLKLITKQ